MCSACGQRSSAIRSTRRSCSRCGAWGTRRGRRDHQGPPSEMNLPLAERVRRALVPARQLIAELTEAWSVAWRRSLQLRVVISTLALSTAVVLVLGLVLQTQIAQRLLQAKEADARVRTETGAVLLERDLSGVDPDREGAQGELNNALDRLTNNTAADDPASPAAGEYRAVLTTARGDAGTQVAAGPVEDV